MKRVTKERADWQLKYIQAGDKYRSEHRISKASQARIRSLLELTIRVDHFLETQRMKAWQLAIFFISLKTGQFTIIETASAEEYLLRRETINAPALLFVAINDTNSRKSSRLSADRRCVRIIDYTS